MTNDGGVFREKLVDPVSPVSACRHLLVFARVTPNYEMPFWVRDRFVEGSVMEKL